LLNHPFYQQIKKNTAHCQNNICLGLDPDLSKIPNHFPSDIKGLTSFLEQVIKNTTDIVIAYKPNISFFEGLGIPGLKLLENIRKWIPATLPMIIDAKRGDIGNTSQMQARYIFDYFGADAVTLHPYMGLDSLEPFFNYKQKYSFILALTSNPGAADFEKISLANNQTLYQYVYQKGLSWLNKYGNIGFVVGATQQELKKLRALDQKSLFLIPGVGAQGGDYFQSIQDGANKDGLCLINMSRSLLYASKETDFLDSTRKKISNYTIQS
jgi:orotidine-5'-phosphate decarboxylase